MTSMTARVLTPWTRQLWDAQCLHDGEPRPDTLVTLTRRRATSSDRWVQLQVEETGAHHYHVVEFLLLLQRLLAVDASLCEEELFAWVKEEQVGSPTAACQRKRCVGGCRLSGADADRSYSSAIVPCSRQGEHWARDDGVMMKPGSKTDTTAVVGVVLDFGESIDGAFVSLLVAAMRDPLGTNGLSDAFKTAFQMLTLSGLKPSSAELHLHLRLSALMPSTVSLRGLAASWSHLDSPGFCADGIDVAAASTNEFLTHVPTLPFTQLHVCASSSSSGRNNPLSAPTKPLDCTSLRLLLAKSQPSLQELDVCNVRLSSFDCITQAYTTGMCRLRALRLREFAMGVVSDGGIFAALRVPSSPITQTLEELEIDQALHSAGGLSFWLEREAGFMLLKNDRLTKCVIRQACSIYPNTTHKGFWRTRGREIRVPVPMSSKLALLSVLLLYKIPREVIVTILEFASRTVVRDTQMLYRPIMPDQLDRFMSDVDAWKPKSMVQYSELPYGSYYH